MILRISKLDGADGCPQAAATINITNPSVTKMLRGNAMAHLLSRPALKIIDTESFFSMPLSPEYTRSFPASSEKPSREKRASNPKLDWIHSVIANAGVSTRTA
jgi:hypothetical protein